MNNLALVYDRTGKYSEAERLYVQATQIFKESLGDQHPFYAQSLDNLAGIYRETGDYTKAEQLYRQAMAIRRAVLGEQHPDYATSLANLALVYDEIGDYAKAESLYRQSLSIQRAAVGEKHPDYAVSLNNFAGLYDSMGDYSKAEPLYRQALAIRKDVLGGKHPMYALSLMNLAFLYSEAGDQQKAEPLYRQAAEILRSALGEKHPYYATCLNNLGGVYANMDDYAKAEPLYRKALAIRKEALGEKSPDYAISLNNVARVCARMGDYAEAKRLDEEALAIRKGLLGERHPLFAASLENLAIVYDDMGDDVKAEPLSRRAVEIMRDSLDATASSQSECQQLLTAASERNNLDDYLSISEHAQISAGDAYAQVLAWKGAIAARQESLRQMRQIKQTERSPEVGRLFDDLAAASRELSNQSLVIPKAAAVEPHRAKLAELNDRVELLQQQLAAKSEEFRNQQNKQRRTPDDIRRALPPDAALVDFLEYDHRSPPAAKGKKPVLERRLVAFVVRRDKPIERIELGSTAAIAGFIDAWRRNFGAHGTESAADPGRELRRLVWDRIEPKLGGAKTVLISPDGATTRFPWPALPGNKPGSYLIDDVAIAIVPVPRLLPELLAAEQPKTTDAPSLLLVGGVDFGADPGRIVDLAIDRGAARGYGTLQWQPLPGTAAEVAAVKAAFAQRYPQHAPMEIIGAAATKDAVRSDMTLCRFLHFSTHGFFAPPDVKSALTGNTRQNLATISGLITRQELSGYHPDLLSGLVLAGANRPVLDGQEDGILTALEVSGLDLSHVELATLSACKTGLGESAGGEGLLGLQRAFQLAGAKTTVASLWKVPDKATQVLMARFYDNLWQKKMSKLSCAPRGATLDAARRQKIARTRTGN